MVRILLMFAGIGLAAFGQVSTKSIRKVMTVCDLLLNPIEFDGTIVTVRGKSQATGEGTWLEGADCSGVFVTPAVLDSSGKIVAEERVWPSVIWLALPSSHDNLRPVNFEFSVESDRRVLAKFKKLQAIASANCIRWTYTGMFETRKEWSKKDAEHLIIFRGFGHQNYAPAQLVLKSKDDVESIPGCHPQTGGNP